MDENENNEGQEVAGPQQEPEASGNQEAAKYRRRLREAEAERDKLVEQVQALRRSEVERQVADQLDDPSDLWRGGVVLDELLDRDGAIEQGKVTEAATAVTAEHPAWAKRPEVSGIDEDQGKSSAQPVGASWAGLLRSGNRER